MFEKIKEAYKKYWFDRIYDPNWLKDKIDDRVKKTNKLFFSAEIH